MASEATNPSVICEDFLTAASLTGDAAEANQKLWNGCYLRAVLMLVYPKKDYSSVSP